MKYDISSWNPLRNSPLWWILIRQFNRWCPHTPHGSYIYQQFVPYAQHIHFYSHIHPRLSFSFKNITCIYRPRDKARRCFDTSVSVGSDSPWSVPRALSVNEPRGIRSWFWRRPRVAQLRWLAGLVYWWRLAESRDGKRGNLRESGRQTERESKFLHLTRLFTFVYRVVCFVFGFFFLLATTGYRLCACLRASFFNV